MFSSFSFRWPWQKKPSAPAPPQCGRPIPHSVSNEFPPPDSVGKPSPPCGETHNQRADRILNALEQAWARRAEAPPSDEAWHLNDVEKLALEFRRQIQALPELIGYRLNSAWVRQRYPLFCKSVGMHRGPPAYKDFAKKLAQLMPRKRYETWREGRRVETSTWYRIQDPAASVVEFAGAQRKRA
jgi:hypothetical protein